MNIIRWPIHNPVFANLIMLFLLFSGFIAVSKMKREATPVFSKDKIKISVSFPHAQPQEVEEGICIKLEQVLQDIAEIDEVESVALEGLAEVICTLKPRSDIYLVMDKIKLNVDTITTFPEDSFPPQVEKVEDRKLLLRIFLYSDISELSLQKLGRNIRDELADLPNVHHVETRGLNKEQVEIFVSDYKLRKHNLTIEDVVAAIRNFSTNHSSGNIETSGNKRNIYIENRAYTAKEYKNIPVVTEKEGTQLLLYEIADVKDSFVEADFKYRFHQKYAAINFRISTPEHYDSLVMAQEVKQYIRDKQKSLPENVHLVVEADFSELIEGTIDILFDNAVVGMILVMVTLTLFLNYKLAFWVAMGIPISFCGGFLMLWFLGKSLNLISMFALVMVLGIVVDDAIVVGENIQTHSTKHSSHRLAAEYGTAEMINSVTTAVLTTIIIFLPLFFIPGTIGKWISEIPLVVIAILIVSLFESFFILPAHLTHVFSTKPPGKIRGALNNAIHFVNARVYTPIYHKVLRYPLLFLAVMFALTILCVGLLKGGRIEFTFFPKADSENLYVDIGFSPGTSEDVIQHGVDIVEKSAQQLNKHFSQPVVKNIYSGIRDNIGFVFLNLEKGEQRNYHSSRILEAWQQLTPDVPGQYFAQFRGEKLTPGGEPIEIQLQSSNFKSLQKAANDIKIALTHFDGVFSIRDDSPQGKYTLTPVLNDKGKLLGITPKSLGTQLADGFAGREVEKIQKNAQEVTILVKYALENKESLEPHLLMIQTPDGEQVPLSEIVTWKVYRGVEKIRRKNNERSITVYANVAESTTTPEKVLSKLQVQTLDNMAENFPDVIYRLGGQHRENKKSSSNLLLGFQYALLAIYIIIALNFGSYLQPIILILILPFACIGAILGHWIMSYPLSAMSIFGIVALCGVAVNDAIVFVEQINVGIKEGKTVKQSLEEAGPKRFRAIVLTTVTTVCGLAPLLLEKSLKAYSIIPMAISMSFGLIFGTLITLFFVPILFQYLNTLRRICAWIASGRFPRAEEVEPSFRSRFTSH